MSFVINMSAAADHGSANKSMVMGTSPTPKRWSAQDLHWGSNVYFPQFPHTLCTCAGGKFSFPTLSDVGAPAVRGGPDRCTPLPSPVLVPPVGRLLFPGFAPCEP